MFCVLRNQGVCLTQNITFELLFNDPKYKDILIPFKFSYILFLLFLEIKKIVILFLH